MNALRLSSDRALAAVATAAAAIVFFTVAFHMFIRPLSAETLPAVLNGDISADVLAEEGTGTSEQSHSPRLLVIPAINLEAKVLAVGISKRGTMAVPDSYSAVGWYRLGPVPGEIGSAVIDGHVDDGAGFPAVFADLYELEEGDEILVSNGDRGQVRFRVTEVTSYALHDIPLRRIFNRSNGTYLNLITCDGKWDDELDGYDKRLVVYAEMVHE